MREPVSPAQTIAISSLHTLQLWIESWAAQELTGPSAAIALYGDLGLGKTQFCRFLAQALGDSTPSASPTFAIHHRYNKGRLTLEHLDLYRMTGPQDIESTGFWDLFDGSENKVIAIEWAERIELRDLPLDWNVWTIHFELGPASESGEQRILRVQKFAAVKR